MRGIVALATLALASGCAFPAQVHRVAIDYNQIIASTSNELTFLNIVRARERHPLHFTSISAMRGDITAQASIGAGVGINEAGPESGNAATSAGISSGPSFDVAVLNSQEFQRGILQPLSAALVSYYLEQGWPHDYIAALFIERIEFTAAGDHGQFRRGDLIAQLENDPDEAEAAAFGRFLRCYVLHSAVIEARETRLMDYEDVRPGSTLEDVRVLDGSTYDLVEADPGDGRGTRRFVSRRTPPSIGLALLRHPAAPSAECILRGPDEAGGGLSLRPHEGAARASPHDRVDTGGQVEVTNGQRQLTIGTETYAAETRIVLRSPLGIIYFLGEYARAPEPYQVEEQRLIEVRLGPSADAFVATRLGGRRYYIPNRDNGRSLQTLAIVQQIVNLQKSASELPRTGAVQIVR